MRHPCLSATPPVHCCTVDTRWHGVHSFTCFSKPCNRHRVRVCLKHTWASRFVACARKQRCGHQFEVVLTGIATKLSMFLSPNASADEYAGLMNSYIVRPYLITPAKDVTGDFASMREEQATEAHKLPALVSLTVCCDLIIIIALSTAQVSNCFQRKTRWVVSLIWGLRYFLYAY